MLFLQELKDNLLSFEKRYYLLIMLVIPSLLLSIFCLPSDIKSLLALYPKNVTPWSLLTANYIHFEWGHLFGNLIPYFFLAFLTMLLEGNKRRFLFMHFIILIVAPIFASVQAIIVIPSSCPVCGFSISVYCLFGYVIYLISDFLSLILATVRKESLILRLLVFLALFLFIMGGFLHQPLTQNGKIINVPGHALSFMLGSLLPLSKRVWKGIVKRAFKFVTIKGLSINLLVF